MKELNIHYFVPENEGELEQLVGKSVGVIDTGNPHLGTIPMTLHKRYERYEFIVQDMRDARSRIPVERILGYEPSSMEFNEDGIRIDLTCCEERYYTFASSISDYQKRLQLLKQNSQWRQPTR